MVKIPIFSGVGTAAAASPHYRAQAIAHASSPLGSLLLSSCYHAFITELASLPPMDLELIDIDVSAFSTPASLLSLANPGYSQNVVISTSFLSLTQSLRYLAYAESLISNNNKLPFSAILQDNTGQHVGILGFSLGMLSACVVASSTTTLSYISHAVEIFKVALWIGVRVQVHRVQTLAKNATIGIFLPWSLVFVGVEIARFKTLLVDFNVKNPDIPLYLTAVLNENAVTVSGRPDILASFAASFDHDLASISGTLVDGLYHAYPAHLCTRNQVLSDLVRRNIKFPAPSEFVAPLFSTLTGDMISSSSSSLPLVEVVIDMILTQPVNWDLVTASAAKHVTNMSEIVELVNIGPGDSLMKGVQQVFSSRRTRVVVQNTYSISFGLPKLEPIAIVGMGLKMPGADSAEELWGILANGLSTVSTIPEWRFDVTSYNNAPSSYQLNAHTGNFISNPAAFDNEFFNISPREARSMDPQQRILLHVAHAALSHAGYVPDATKCFERNKFGCYIGAATNDYTVNLRDEIDIYYSTGTLRSFQSGRISYVMRWGGPSVVVDTACSSSLVAIYQACRALQNRDCNAALAGGVNVITSPDMFIGLDKGHFLSPSGQCKPFDALADGYSRSEGCGLFVLKRLSDAVDENDRILGVIRGVEVNHSDNSSSITRPDIESQQALFLRLMENARIDPHMVSVLEAHGTGTQVGDVSEMESIRRVFGSASRKTKNPLHVTSVKANIGHLEAASGSASLAKLLLMFRYRIIPRLISVNKLNPLIGPLDTDGIALDLEMKPWTLFGSDEEERSRLAVLNNYGAAGSNASLLLEEYEDGRGIQEVDDKIPFVLAISGKTVEAVEALRALYIDFLSGSQTTRMRICDIAYTATARREIYGYRLAVSGCEALDLVEKLNTASIVRTHTIPTSKVIFVFSGQGNQYLGMGSQLYKTCPLFRNHIDECQSILVSLDFQGMLEMILGQEDDCESTQAGKCEVDQIAVFSLEYALSRLWISWGVEPIAVIGHSLGEYAALVTAGVLSLRSALSLVANRSRLMIRKCASGTTGMLSVSLLDPVTLTEIMTCPRLSIACYNSPSNCVLSGPIEDLKKLKTYLDVHVHCKSVLLDVPFGYHSSSMDPILHEITSLAHKLSIHPPTIPVISNTLGDVVLPGDSTSITAEYFAHHCRQPVLLTQGIDVYLNKFDHVDVWIEIGPHASCLPMVKTHEKVTKDTLFLPSLIRGQDSWVTLTDSLAQLYLRKVPVCWRDVFCHVSSVSCVDLPLYPFNPVDFWVPYRKDNLQGQAKDHVEQIDQYRMIHARQQTPGWANGRVAVYETPIGFLATFIQGHVVAGQRLCPGSVYNELALASIKLTSSRLDTAIILSDIEYTNPLVYDAASHTTILTAVTIIDDLSGMFSICSQRDSYNDEVVHCYGRYQATFTPQESTSQIHDLSQKILEVISDPQNGRQPSESFSTRTVYEVLFPRVVSYSKEYHTIQKITVVGGGLEGYAVARLPQGYDKSNFVVHPVFVDTLLHVAGFLSNLQGDIRDVCVCSRVGHVKIIPQLVDNNAKYGIYCGNLCASGEGIVVGEVFAVKLGGSKQIVACLKEICFRRLRLASFVRGLATTVGEDHDHRTHPGCVIGSMSQSDISNTISVDCCDEARKIVADVSRVDPLSFGAELDLDLLGVDSLMLMEISAKIQELVPSVNTKKLWKARTLDELAKVMAESSASSISSGNVTFTDDYLCFTVTSTVAEACGIDPPSLDIDVDLGSLGVDSLMVIEISAKLRKLFPSQGSTVFSISSGCTIRDIVNIMSPLSARKADLRRRTLSTASTQSKIDEPTVQSLLANVLGLEQTELHADDELHALRSDSLISLEAIHLLQNEFGVSLPIDLFETALTSAEVEAQITKHRNAGPYKSVSGVSRSDRPCVPMQRSDRFDAAPLFLIHDGSGLTHYYERVSKLCRDVFAINNPRFVSEETWADISIMAEEYTEIIIRESAYRPVLLGGWSFGGVVAFEIACQLMQRGLEVKGVLLIDSPSPVDRILLPESLLECAVYSNAGFSSNPEVAKLMKTQLRMNSALLTRYEPPKLEWYPRAVFLRSKEGLASDIGENIPAWLADRNDARTAVEGWERLLGKEVKMWDIPGNHFQPFMPAKIEEVSCRIADGCNFLDSEIDGL